MCERKVNGNIFVVAYRLRHIKLDYLYIFFILPLIFVHLKMPEEHTLRITKSLKTQGRLYYSKPFDRLLFDGQIKLIIVPIESYCDVFALSQAWMLYPIHRFQVQDEVKIFGAGLSVQIKSYIQVNKFGLIHVCIVDLSVYMKFIHIAIHMELDFIYMDDSEVKSIQNS